MSALASERWRMLLTVSCRQHERWQLPVSRDVVQGRDGIDEVEVVRVVRIAIVGGPSAACRFPAMSKDVYHVYPRS